MPRQTRREGSDVVDLDEGGEALPGRLFVWMPRLDQAARQDVLLDAALVGRRVRRVVAAVASS